MSDKHITLPLLRKTILRNKSETDNMLREALAGTQVGITITLVANQWLNKTQIVQNTAFLADENYIYFVCSNNEISADNVTVDGQMIFHCNNVPTTDMVVEIIRLEVER